MRRSVVVLGLMATCLALPPQAADARPAILRALTGIVTAPLALLGGGLRSHRGAHHRRAYVSRRRPAAAAAVAGGAAATAATVATAPAAQRPVNQPSADVTPPPETTASAPPQPATTETPPTAATSVSNPPVQRNAALPQAETEGLASEPPRSSDATSRTRTVLGSAGPAAWPTAFEDVVGYSLWPKDYGAALRSHGIGDVIETALAPGGATANVANRRGAQQARADDKVVASSGCTGWDLSASDWPMAKISSTIELNDAQKDTLNQFKSSLNDALTAVKSSCRDNTAATPVQRLRAMQTTLWAVHDAAQLIRAPLARFYDSLTEQQKQQLSAADSSAPRNPGRVDMSKVCDMPASIDAPMRRIDQSLRPTKAQHASLDSLQQKSFEMGQFLMASCLKPVPGTPAERLDAAADRLTALIFAASNVNMALNDFTSQLNDDQKTKLNSLAR